MAKRASAKKQAGTKKTSKKTVKKAVKKKPVKKTTAKKKTTKASKATKKTAKKAVKKTTKKVAKKVASKKTAKKKVTKKTSKKAPNKVTKKVSKKASKKVAKKATKKLTKKVVKKATKKVEKKATKKAVKKAVKKLVKKVPRKKNSFTAAENKGFVAILIEKRRRIRSSIDAMEGEALAVIEGAGSSLHNADCGSDVYGQSLAIGLVEKEAIEIKKIDRALVAIKNRFYGICEMCEKIIPTRRLQVIPFAKFCVSCKEKYEDQLATGIVHDVE